jgi:hypothetical protein
MVASPVPGCAAAHGVAHLLNDLFLAGLAALGVLVVNRAGLAPSYHSTLDGNLQQPIHLHPMLAKLHQPIRGSHEDKNLITPHKEDKFWRLQHF